MRRGSQSKSLTDVDRAVELEKGARPTTQKRKSPPKVSLGEPNLFFALSDLPASPRQSTTTDSVAEDLRPFF